MSYSRSTQVVSQVVLPSLVEKLTAVRDELLALQDHGMASDSNRVHIVVPERR